MNAKILRTAVGVLAGTLCVSSASLAVTPQKFSGSIAGIVSDTSGIPQMGASVLLYNRFDKLLSRILTSERGTFGFASLPPDSYTIRVSLASFLPALKRDILVQPGMRSLLNVSLASVFSSIELVAVAPGQTPLMSDEWRWVLRSTSSTRPVLRMLPELAQSDPRPRRRVASIFSDTRGVVRLSGGDQAGSSLGTEPDLGTAFALATSVGGSNQFQVSGNFGYSAYTNAPTAAIRTSFHRETGGISVPEVKLTMRQLFIPLRVGADLYGAGMQDSLPALRTLSATMLDSKQLSDSVRLEYGASLDSVTFLDRLNYISPFGRLTIDRGNGAAFELGYASGTPPAEAFLNEGGRNLEFQQDLAALAMFPRVSLSSGRARVQRTETIEIGYRKKAGSRTFSVAAYNDSVNNAAVTMISPDGQPGLDLLPDLLSNGWTANAGRFRSIGYMMAVTQEVGSHFDMTLAYGSGGALVADRGAGPGAVFEDVQSAIRVARRQSLTGRISGTLPASGTQLIASYQWSNVAALNAAHMFLTQRTREGLGLDVRVSQPVPYFGGLPGHLEATAELRNLLAQGYTPLNLSGRRVYLLQVPRSVRGGLSFSF
jgi:hypothetical protein